MNLPRPRFTMRRLILVVAIVGLLVGGWLWGERRRTKFAELEFRHQMLSIPRIIDPDLKPGPPKEVANYHREMAEKYRFAATYPWLPVAPDPPEPE
jgi:hypothetical protein